MRRMALVALILVLALFSGVALAADTPTPAKVEKMMQNAVDRIESRFDMPCYEDIERVAPFQWRISLRCFPHGK